jgi:hypothetical protein
MSPEGPNVPTTIAGTPHLARAGFASDQVPYAALNVARHPRGFPADANLKSKDRGPFVHHADNGPTLAGRAVECLLGPRGVQELALRVVVQNKEPQ